jgi:hypothetical protein
MMRRLFLASVCLLAASAATPQLTTIQDILYKADGTRFNGILTISWGSFQSPDSANIVTQSITVRVVDGILRVQLVPSPTAPAAYYAVVYNADGRVQFQETWSVPASSKPLLLAAVRVNSAAANVTAGGSGSGGPIPESQVTGLVADLSARPLEGPAYAPGGVAVINSLGSIDAITGSASDCVHVDGSSGACGSSGGGANASFVDSDSLSGAVNGSNTSFTLSHTPSPSASLALYRNGIMQKTGQDFSIGGSTVVFASNNTPQSGDTLLASYRVAGTVGAANPAPQVLCSGTGAATNATSLSSIGACEIPAGVLLAGDRVEIHFDLAHSGSASGFTFEVDWAATRILNRSGAAADVLISGRAEAAVLSAGSQLSAQSWGTVLPFSAAAAPSTDAYTSGITINFQGMLAQTGDTLALANYSVVRVP